MGRTTALRQALKQRFFPHVESRGFDRDESDAPQVLHFRRFISAKIEVFSLRWDKYARPIFHITFNEAPLSGVTVRGVHIAAQNIHPQDPSFPLSLQRSRGPYLRCWFQLRRPLLKRLSTWRTEYTPEEVVDALLNAYPEMEAWWASGLIGPHVYAPLDTLGGFRSMGPTSNQRLERR